MRRRSLGRKRIRVKGHLDPGWSACSRADVFVASLGADADARARCHAGAGLAGSKGIPRQPDEVAEIDGAGPKGKLAAAAVEGERDAPTPAR